MRRGARRPARRCPPPRAQERLKVHLAERRITRAHAMAAGMRHPRFARAKARERKCRAGCMSRWADVTPALRRTYKEAGAAQPSPDTRRWAPKWRAYAAAHAASPRAAPVWPRATIRKSGKRAARFLGKGASWAICLTSIGSHWNADSPLLAEERASPPPHAATGGGHGRPERHARWREAVVRLLCPHGSSVDLCVRDPGLQVVRRRRHRWRWPRQDSLMLLHLRLHQRLLRRLLDLPGDLVGAACAPKGAGSRGLVLLARLVVV